MGFGSRIRIPAPFDSRMQGNNVQESFAVATPRRFGGSPEFQELKSSKYLLGGAWVVISRDISPLIRVISIATFLITPIISTHEPPSN